MHSEPYFIRIWAIDLLTILQDVVDSEKHQHRSCSRYQMQITSKRKQMLMLKVSFLFVYSCLANQHSVAIKFKLFLTLAKQDSMDPRCCRVIVLRNHSPFKSSSFHYSAS